MTYGFLLLFAFVRTISYQNWFDYVELYYLQLFTIMAYHLKARYALTICHVITFDIWVVRIMSYCLIITSKPCGVVPLKDLSHPQFSSSPLEQARVNAWATPAEEIACTNAISRVPEKNTIYSSVKIANLVHMGNTCPFIFDPLSLPTITAYSDHYFHICPLFKVTTNKTIF